MEHDTGIGQQTGRGNVSFVLFVACTFLSAFLLFLIQPLIGKAILPLYGSSAGTWAVTLVFFQLALVIGYLYAHILSQFVARRHQLKLHAGFLVLALLTLPVFPRPNAGSLGGGNPSLDILVTLLLAVGLPYLLLASTSPLLQRWYAASGAEYPYRLYAVSNTGSLLALFAYPLLLEPTLGVRNQAMLWSIAFVVFALLAILISWQVFRDTRGEVHYEDASSAPVGFRQVLMWLALSALPSGLLVATTTRLTQNVPPAPFLFVVPLALYLLSFVIVFHSPRWYQRRLFCPMLIAGASGALWLSLGGHLPLFQELGIVSLATFFCFVCAHGELVCRRPAPVRLTTFYLWVSVGGALGGLIVALIVPLVLVPDIEFELALLLTAAFLLSVYLKPLWPGSLSYNWAWLGRALIVGIPWFASVVVILLHSGKREQDWEGTVLLERSFYAVIRVVRADSVDPLLESLTLYHGDISHGREFVHPTRANNTSLYYGPRSGMGKAITRHPKYGIHDEQFRIGAIGMGVGTVAAYLNAPVKTERLPLVNDRIVFYEIDSTLSQIAQSEFSFLDNARTRGVEVDVRLGDARQLMERERIASESQKFHVLVVDAFSGDAVPVHLLTREALDLYMSHLRDDGVLAYHISNRHFDLEPVVTAVAADAELDIQYHYGGFDDSGHLFSAWILLGKDLRAFGDRSSRFRRRGTSKIAPLLWTDDHNALYPLIDRDLFLPRKPRSVSR